MMIDPPAGWLHGFPKVLPKEHFARVNEWLVENGYPKSLIESYGDKFYYRCWEEIEDGE